MNNFLDIQNKEAAFFGSLFLDVLKELQPGLVCCS
jgi:hypothetical protein